MGEMLAFGRYQGKQLVYSFVTLLMLRKVLIFLFPKKLKYHKFCMFLCEIMIIFRGFNKFFLSFFFLPFLWPLLQHMEVPRLGV